MRRSGALLLLTTLLNAAQAADLTITVLDRNGKALQDAVVQLDSSMAGARPAQLLDVSIAQEKLRFVPTVTVVPLGGRVGFSNLDSWDHHVIVGLVGAGGVFLDSGKNTQMRLAGRVAARPPSTETRSFTQPGAYLLGCHLHSSMRGHLFVADSPWAKLSGEDGRVLFSELPVGPARLRIWHADQLLDAAALDVQVTGASGAAQALSVTTQISPRRKPSNKPAADPAAYGY